MALDPTSIDEVRTVETTRTYSFTPQDIFDLMCSADLIDTEKEQAVHIEAEVRVAMHATGTTHTERIDNARPVVVRVTTINKSRSVC